jgi:hypothetical protein
MAALSLIPGRRTSPASHSSTARPHAWCIATAARASQRCYQQRGRGRGRHTSADESDQSRAPTLLRRQITPLCTALTVHHSNDPIFCRQHEAVADRRIYKNPGNSTSVVASRRALSEVCRSGDYAGGQASFAEQASGNGAVLWRVELARIVWEITYWS